MRALPPPPGATRARGDGWPVLVTDAGGTLPALLTVAIADESAAMLHLRLEHRGRVTAGAGMPSLAAALDDLAAALAPAYLRACATCRLSRPGPDPTLSDQVGLPVGRHCQRAVPAEPVLDTHWCDRYERIGSPR